MVAISVAKNMAGNKGIEPPERAVIIRSPGRGRNKVFCAVRSFYRQSWNTVRPKCAHNSFRYIPWSGVVQDADHVALCFSKAF